MNQILDYNPNKGSGGAPKSDKVVRIFAIILAIFAVCLLAGGAYGIYKNNKTENVSVDAPTKAKISVEEKEETAVIKVSHDKAIEKLIYSWDSGKETSIKGNGDTELESEISLIAGTHTLTVKVTDIDGNETLFEKEIVSENGEDKIYPEIELRVDTEQKPPKIIITATDETAMDFITYRWNDEEEQRVDVSEEDEKKIEVAIDILKGQNDLLVVAVDKNNNNTTKNESYTGVTNPEIKIEIAPDKRSADVLCTHENGIEKIELKVNEEVYNIEIEEGTTPTEVSFQIEERYFSEGTNVITVTATSVEGTETVAIEEIVPDLPAEPEITIEVENVEDSQELAAIVTVTSAVEIKEIQLNINGESYVAEPDQGTLTTDLEITYDLLNEGENEVKIKVIDVNGGEKEEVVTLIR